MKQQIHALNKDLASERKQHWDLEALHLQLHTDLQNLVPISNIYQIHDIIYGFYFEILLTFRICFQRLRDNKSLMETSEAQDEHDNVLNERKYNFFSFQICTPSLPFKLIFSSSTTAIYSLSWPNRTALHLFPTNYIHWWRNGTRFLCNDNRTKISPKYKRMKNLFN